MSPEFEYFSWGTIEDTRPSFALFDALDNHLMMISEKYINLYHLKKLLKSKTILEIVDLSNVQSGLIDNSVVESWGMEHREDALFGNIRMLFIATSTPDMYFKRMVIKNSNLVRSNVVFDDFKTDLQKQIFFLYYCIDIWIERFPDNNHIYKHIERATLLSKSYDDAVEQILTVSSTDEQEAQDLLDFLRSAGLYYE